MAINSAASRSQDQLHIHVACIAPESHPIFEQAQAIFAFLGGGAMATALLAFFANFFVNKVIERQKGALNKELERLKAELSKEAESHKLIPSLDDHDR